MELTTKRAFTGKTKGEIQVLRVAALAVASFFISRAMIMGQMFPAGIALLAALLSYNALYLYLLPFLLFGIGTFYNSGIPILGDMGALCGCALVFLCTAKIRLKTWHKAAITGSVTVIASSVYYITAGFSYRISSEELVLEGLFAAALCGVFSVLAGIHSSEEKRCETAEGVFCVCVAVALIVAGSGVSWLLLVTAMVMVLFIGYRFGASEGMMAALGFGLVILLHSGETAPIFSLSIGGVTAGFLREQSKILVALCFTAAVFAAGIPDFSLNLRIPYYAPAAAALILILLPGKWIFRFDAALSAYIKADTYREKQEAAGVSAYLRKTAKNFDDLCALFAGQDNRRLLLSYEFKAMSQMTNRAMRNICGMRERGGLRYVAEPAWAGYARDQSVSGDSCVWEELPDGNFAMILSDGMGKGERAASESSLAVSAAVKLLKTGIDVELVLKLLNSILLLNAENEVFSTIDLGIFNRKSGKMKFYKIGAAASFIKRRNSVEVLSVSAMPMGIVDGLKVDYVETGLTVGDQVIMISDGVTDSKREDTEMKWLTKAIGEIRSKDPQTMCDLIMNRAVENYGLREKDDLTVMALRIN